MDTRGAAHFITSLELKDLPPQVVARAKLCIMDAVGIMLGGLDTRAARIARGLAESRGGKEESTLFGSGAKVPAPQAASANCVAADTLDFGDGHNLGGPPGSVVVPSALAVAEAQRSSGARLVEAVVAGYEVSIRAMAYISNGEPGPSGETPAFPATGQAYHHPGTGGAYGAAAAAAKLLGCDQDQTAHTLGIAAAHAPSTRPFTIQFMGHMAKGAMGWGGLTGVEAAYLAQHGFTGPNTIFDDEASRGTSVDTLGSAFEILNTYFKPYPACRYLHTALDATLALIEKHSLSADQVSSVKVVIRDRQATFSNPRPVSIQQAQYSFPFTIGAVLAYGHHGPDTMTEEKLTDPAILQQADKVVMVPNPSVNLTDWTTDVVIETRDAKTHRRQVAWPKGDPRNPMTEEELTSKFLGMATPALGEARARRALEAIQNLERAGGVEDLVELLNPPGPHPVSR